MPECIESSQGGVSAQPMSSTILVVGAGLAGLAASIRLSQNSNFKIRVVERTPSPQTIGGAINVAPNGGRLLSRLGVYDKVRAAGCTVPRIDLFNDRGASLGSFPNCSADGFVGVRIMRSALHAILLERSEQCGVKVEFGRGVERIEDADQAGEVIIVYTDGARETADLVIGADGIHSRVREYVVHPQKIDPSYSGTSLVYGLTDAKRFPTKDMTALPATWGVFGQRAFFAGAFCVEDRSQLYWISAQMKEVAEKLDDPETIRSQELNKFGQFFVPIPEIIEHTTEFFSWPVFELPVLDHWSRGHAVLVGDAAHALSPNKGQGFSQALEDVFVLARLVEVGGKLSVYEKFRRPRVEKLRQTIKDENRDRPRSPWQAWLRDWAFWGFLKAVNLAPGWWMAGDFGYDPDAIEI